MGTLGSDRRRFVQAAASAAALRCGSALAQPRYDAMVGPGGHASVGEALAGAPDNAARPYCIVITPGRWREKLFITKPNIWLIGQSKTHCVLSYDDASRTPGPDGAPMGTYKSCSIMVQAPDFSAQNLTIENAFDFDAAAREPVVEGRADSPALTPPRITDRGLQGVALMLADGAERTWIENCAITGHQDTLFTNRGRAFFHRCTISSTIDFIFGAGRALFSQCDIISRARADAGGGRFGWVSAASTPRTQAYGLVFDHCALVREALVPQRSVGLGRFWRPTTTFPDGRYGDPEAAGSTAFLSCWLGDHIIPEGWDPMGYNAKGGARASLSPQEARPAEFSSRGPGARERPFQITAQDALRFEARSVLGGWTPGAG